MGQYKPKHYLPLTKRHYAPNTKIRRRKNPGQKFRSAVHGFTRSCAENADGYCCNGDGTQLDASREFWIGNLVFELNKGHTLPITRTYVLTRVVTNGQAAPGAGRVPAGTA